MKYTGCNTALETLTLNQPPVIDVIDALDGDDCGELNADTTFMSMKIRLNKQLALYWIRCAYGGVGWNMSKLFDLPDQLQIYGKTNLLSIVLLLQY